MAFFLGIDAGGTKTECVIGDDQRVLGSSVGATIKIKKVGEEQAGQALEMVLQQVCAEARVSPQQISATCCGIAGFSIPEVADWSFGVLKQLLAGEVVVVNDTVIAHEAAFHGGPGVLVIAGTGSNVLGIDAEGHTARAGGWGPIISDEGSGSWIGRLAVAQAMRAHDSGRETKLLSFIMEAWSLTSIADVVSMANCNPPPDFACLLPAVLACAEQEDTLANEIIRAAARELAELTTIVIRKLWQGEESVDVALTGGVFSHSAQFCRLFAEEVAARYALARVNVVPVHPVMGALSMARAAWRKRAAVLA